MCVAVIMYKCVKWQGNKFSKCETCTIPSPSVQGQNLSSPLLLFGEIFHHSPSTLVEGRPHYFSEVSLHAQISISGFSNAGYDLPDTKCPVLLHLLRGL